MKKKSFFLLEFFVKESIKFKYLYRKIKNDHHSPFLSGRLVVYHKHTNLFDVFPILYSHEDVTHDFKASNYLLFKID